MNLSAAFDISQKSTDALSQAMGAAQLMLSRKKQERDARLARFEDVVAMMEAEMITANSDIADLEKMIFGEKKAGDEPTEAEVAAHEAETERDAA